MQRTEPGNKRRRDYIAPQVPSIPMLVRAGPIREVRKMALKTNDIALDFPVVMLCRPQIQGSRCDFVNYGHGVTIHRQVHGLEVMVTGVTSFHPYSGDAFRGIARQLLVVLFATGWTENPAKLPFGHAKRTKERALTAVSFSSDYRELRTKAASWTEFLTTRKCRDLRSAGYMFGLRLEQNPGKKSAPAIGRVRRFQPLVQHLVRLVERLAAQSTRRLCQCGRTCFGHDFYQRRKGICRLAEIKPVAEPRTTGVRGPARHSKFF